MFGGAQILVGLFARPQLGNTLRRGGAETRGNVYLAERIRLSHCRTHRSPRMKRVLVIFAAVAFTLYSTWGCATLRPGPSHARHAIGSSVPVARPDSKHTYAVLLN